MTTYTHSPIKSWALEDRPREKLLQRGTESLTDAELIALLLGSGTQQCSAIDLARQIVAQRGGLLQLARSSVKDLTQVKGVGPAKAITIVAAFELGRRKMLIEPRAARISSAADAARILVPRIGDQNQEVFYLLMLNRNNEVIAEKELFRGGLSATVIDPKLVFREAIQHLAAALIVAHNHPSGNLRPSQADIQITERLVAAGKSLDLPIIDHLIITSGGYCSFADEGLLGK